jgi:hypothetical protein
VARCGNARLGHVAEIAALLGDADAPVVLAGDGNVHRPGTPHERNACFVRSIGVCRAGHFIAW